MAYNAWTDENDAPDLETFITNFSVNELDIYEQAIKEYGRDELFINEEAWSASGYLMKNSRSLHCATHRDLSKFWKIFKRIKYGKGTP